MPDIEKILAADCICELEVSNKSAALKELARLAGVTPQVSDTEKFLEDIRAREMIMSTGIGSGIAIPHARSSALNDLVMAVGRSRDGIEYESLDGLPVNIIILLGAPEKNKGLFLEIFAGIGAMFSRSGVRGQFLKADNPEEMKRLFVEQFRRR